MGVYIKGFEIAEDHACVVCRLSTKTAFDKLPFCDVTMKDIEDWSKRPEWCPLVPVPEPHGRLIDADALRAKQQEDADLFQGSTAYCDKCRRDEAMNAVANIVNAPTIIPAEEEAT